MKKYNRVMLGQKSKYAVECFEGGFIGTDFGLDLDLTGQLDENWRDFNKKLIPVFLSNRPDKSKVAAGLACGMTWTVAKGLNVGDVVLCPDGTGRYRPGEITGDYYYARSQILFHRRPVKWFDEYINRSDMSPELQRSTGSIGTCCEITNYAEEIEGLIKGKRPPTIISNDETVEDPSVFALEKHLEDFLVANWSSTELGKNYDIFENGRQYQTDTGPLDILAQKKDRQEFMILELKRDKASDVAVAQTLRYINYIRRTLATNNEKVRGCIIATEEDRGLMNAIEEVPNIDFYKYSIRFSLNMVNR